MAGEGNLAFPGKGDFADKVVFEQGLIGPVNMV